MDWHKRLSPRWRAKCRSLNPYVEGIYLRLTDEYIETGRPLPDDDSDLAGIARISLEDFEANKIRAILTAVDKQGKPKFFKVDGEKWIQSTCDELIAERRELSEAGKRGVAARIAKAKKNKNPFKSTSHASPPSSPPLSPASSERERERKRDGKESLVTTTNSIKGTSTTRGSENGASDKFLGNWKARDPHAMLEASAIDRAKKWCPRWDMNGAVIPRWWRHITKTFEDKPNDFNASFVAFCKTHIAGKPP